MRLQFNKICRKLDDDMFIDFHTKVQNDIIKDWSGEDLDDIAKRLAEHTPHMELRCRYCENCGTELFGLWLWLIYNIGDEMGYAAFHDYEKERRAWEKDLKQIRDEEMHSFKTMKKCPICNEPLQHDWSHYYEEHDFAYKTGKPLQRLLGDTSTGFRWKFFYNNFKQVPKQTLEQNLKEVLDETFAKMSDRGSFTTESIFKSKEYQGYKTNQEKALELINDFTNRNDNREEFSVLDANNTNVIKGDIEKLKEYILKVILIENNVYSLTKRLNDLYEQRVQNIKQLNRFVYAPVVESINNRYLQIDKINEGIEKIARFITEKEEFTDEQTKELQYLLEVDRGELVKLELTKPRKPELKKVGLFNKEATIANNNKLQQEYDLALARYNEEVEELNKQIDAKIVDLKKSISNNKQKIGEAYSKHNQLFKMLEEKENEANPVPIANISELLPCTEIIVKDLLDDEISTAEDLLKKTFAERKRLYDMNVIFGKYRDVVALTTFYEYLMSGRCSELDGPNGAYNIYEAECRANIIISKLSEAVSLLEDIKQSQYMLYSALNGINREIKTLNTVMNSALDSLNNIEINTAVSNVYLDNISKNSQVIAYNTERTAYYSKKNAELTDSLGYMVALS